MSRTAPEFYKGRQIDGRCWQAEKESNRSDCKAVKFAIALLLYFSAAHTPSAGLASLQKCFPNPLLE